jgi:hypothetical protein
MVLACIAQTGWAQTVCKCQVKIDNTFHIVPMTNGIGADVGTPPLYENDNATTPAIALPFHFCFYNHSYDSVYISNNGIISFVKPIYAFIDSTQHIPLGVDTQIIAPFFADANTVNNAGQVYYKITSTHMIVIWDSVRFAGVDVDGWNTFQLTISNGTDKIIPDGNNVSFCYPVIQWACSESSGGFSGYGGTPAFIGINKGDGIHYAQVGTYSLPGNFYYGPFSTLNGVDWLDFQSFTFNTCTSGNVIAPMIVDNIPDSNKLYICPCDTSGVANVALGAADSILIQPCDTITMAAQFLCTELGQTAVLSYTCSGPLNISSVYTSTGGLIDSIIIQAIPVFGDTGTQLLKLTATDTINHVQSSVTYTLVITVDCHDIPVPPPDSTGDTTGINELGTSAGFSLYPNPADKNITIKCNTAGVNTMAKIYDVMGVEMFSGNINQGMTNIDVSAWARAMYFVELFKDGISLPPRKVILE